MLPATGAGPRLRRKTRWSDCAVQKVRASSVMALEAGMGDSSVAFRYLLLYQQTAAFPIAVRFGWLRIVGDLWSAVGWHRFLSFLSFCLGHTRKGKRKKRRKNKEKKESGVKPPHSKVGRND